MSNYKTEFPDFDYELTLPSDWIDSSWHNDICPSFEAEFEDMRYRIFCDYADPARREVGGLQFAVAKYINEDELEAITEFDTLQEALDFVNKETQA